MFDEIWSRELPADLVSNLLVTSDGMAYVSTASNRPRRMLRGRNRDGSTYELHAEPRPVVHVDALDPSNPREFIFDLDRVEELLVVSPGGEVHGTGLRIVALAELSNGSVLAVTPECRFVQVDSGGALSGEMPIMEGLKSLSLDARMPQRVLAGDGERTAFIDLRSASREIIERDERQARRYTELMKDAAYWIESNTVRRCYGSEPPEDVLELTPDMAQEALQRFADRTGHTEDVRSHQVDLGWYVADDPLCDRVFAFSNLGPHVLCAIETSGAFSWCEIFSLGCCGGPPQSVAPGKYACASGCGGVVSWFDEGGRLLAQSAPPTTATLGGALGELTVAPDGRVFGVRGWKTTVAWDSEGRLLGESSGPEYRVVKTEYHPEVDGLLVWRQSRPEDHSSRLSLHSTPH